MLKLIVIVLCFFTGYGYARTVQPDVTYHSTIEFGTIEDTLVGSGSGFSNYRNLMASEFRDGRRNFHIAVGCNYVENRNEVGLKDGVPVPIECQYSVFSPDSIYWTTKYNQGTTISKTTYGTETSFYHCPGTSDPNYTRKVYLRSDPSNPEKVTQILCAQECKPPYQEMGASCVKKCAIPELFFEGEMSCRDPNESRAHPPICEAGNPVQIRTGQKIQREAPEYAYGLLRFQRSYYSFYSADAKSRRAEKLSKISTGYVRYYYQPLGYEPTKALPLAQVPTKQDVNRLVQGGAKNWTHNYQKNLDVVNNRVIIYTAGEPAVVFTIAENDQYTVNHRLANTLTRVALAAENSWHWVHYTANGDFEYYNDEGKLIRLIDAHGNQVDLDYDMHGFIKTAIDKAGRKLIFSFSEQGLLESLSTPDGVFITYGYDELDNLTSVAKQYSNGKTVTRTYHYEDPQNPYLLTGITDENDKRFATWAYNEQDQVILSEHAGGADRYTFEYDIANHQTKVTNPLGKASTYFFHGSWGAYNAIKKIEGHASLHCDADEKTYVYDGFGRVSRINAPNGNSTVFEYNARNLVIKKTEAYGKPEARVTITTWHPTFNLPETVTVGNQVTTYHYSATGQLENKTIKSL